MLHHFNTTKEQLGKRFPGCAYTVDENPISDKEKEIRLFIHPPEIHLLRVKEDHVRNVQWSVGKKHYSGYLQDKIFVPRESEDEACLRCSGLCA